MKRIPLVLVAGFLGAGKTTFLRALMGELKERGVPFSVVVNDFENAEIDAARLRDLDVEVRSINGSCVCCSSLHEFMLTLGQIEVPEGGVLLVEANGASDFISLIAAISLRGECRRFLSPMQVTMIDAARWQQRGVHDELEREQVRTSTHWMLTHTARVPERRLESVRRDIARLTPRGQETEAGRFADFLRLQVITAGVKQSALDSGLLVKSPPSSGVFGQALHNAAPMSRQHHHHHEAERAFTSLRVRVPFVVDRRELENTLLRLPDEVLRVKGLCRLAELPMIPFSFQHVRPQGETWFLPLLAVRDIIPAGVVIGVGLPEQIVQNAFANLPSAELAPEEPLPG